MLNPNTRSLYTSALTPPLGMVFDEAIATTFSMDPSFLLEAPVYLALMAADSQTDPDPLSVLEAIRRYSKHITVYVQRGRIQIPQIKKPNPLFGFLEKMVIEVNALNGGVFHPKIWAIRFVNPDQNSTFYRLVILTRNMTTDHSWDLSLQLEGSITNKKIKSNNPLTYFFENLPRLAIASADSEKIAQSAKFAGELQRVHWTLPDGYDELTFYLPGSKKFNWIPPSSNRMAVISPFCSDDFLQEMRLYTKNADVLISRPESLSSLRTDTLKLFNQCRHLDEAALSEDGEDTVATKQSLANSLHAKAYIFEKGRDIEIVIGSANATNAALKLAKNTEILVGLVGRKSRVGGIDDLLSSDGLGEYLINFQPCENIAPDESLKAAEVYVENARMLISKTALAIKCKQSTKDGFWELELIGVLPPLDGIVSVTSWPITVISEKACNINTNGVNSTHNLGEFTASSVTGLIAFELKSTHPDVTAKFVLNIPISGIPDERNSAIMQTIISNREGFLRYLLLLLGNENGSNNDQLGSSGIVKWLARMANTEDISLLEELIRTFSRQPEKLTEISGVIRELSTPNTRSVIPEDFLNLWKVFDSAIGESNDK